MHITHQISNLVSQLRKVYEPHNQRLFNFLGYSIPEWNVDDRPRTPKSEEITNPSSFVKESVDPGSL